MIIRNKRQMYEIYERGGFGNKLRTWMDVPSLLGSGFNGFVTIRGTNSADSKLARYNVPVNEVADYVSVHQQAGHTFGYNESAPDERLDIQGEIQDVPGCGLCVRYSPMKTKMRTAMESDTVVHLYGRDAYAMLRRKLSPASFDDIMDLLRDYEGHCIEFSAYYMPLGNARGRNTVIWEIRSY